MCVAFELVELTVHLSSAEGALFWMNIQLVALHVAYMKKCDIFYRLCSVLSMSTAMWLLVGRVVLIFLLLLFLSIHVIHLRNVFAAANNTKPESLIVSNRHWNIGAITIECDHQAHRCFY